MRGTAATLRSSACKGSQPCKFGNGTMTSGPDSCSTGVTSWLLQQQAYGLEIQHGQAIAKRRKLWPRHIAGKKAQPKDATAANSTVKRPICMTKQRQNVGSAEQRSSARKEVTSKGKRTQARKGDSQQAIGIQKMKERNNLRPTQNADGKHSQKISKQKLAPQRDDR